MSGEALRRLRMKMPTGLGTRRLGLLIIGTEAVAAYWTATAVSPATQATYGRLPCSCVILQGGG